MVKFYRKSATFSALWVSKNDRLSDFYVTSWQRGESPVPMLVVRVILASCALAILTWSLVEGASPYWLIYLTNWGLLLVTATVISGLVVSITFLCRNTFETTELPWFVSLYWLLLNLTVTISLMITALYWIMLYDPESYESTDSPARALWLDIATHGLAACIVLTELLISRTPVRLAHVYQPLGIGLWYTVFTVIFYASGGTDGNGNKFIYAVLDWQNPKRTIIVVVCSIVCLVLMYLLLICLALCREKLSIMLVRTTSHDLPTTPHEELDPRVV